MSKNTTDELRKAIETYRNRMREAIDSAKAEAVDKGEITMSKIEVRVIMKNGDVEEYNPVNTITIGVQDGYNYDFEIEEIEKIELYPMEAEL